MEIFLVPSFLFPFKSGVPWQADVFTFISHCLITCHLLNPVFSKFVCPHSVCFSSILSAGPLLFQKAQIHSSLVSLSLVWHLVFLPLHFAFFLSLPVTPADAQSSLGSGRWHSILTVWFLDPFETFCSTLNHDSPKLQFLWPCLHLTSLLCIPEWQVYSLQKCYSPWDLDLKTPSSVTPLLLPVCCHPAFDPQIWTQCWPGVVD